jgi:uncharacterized protein YndB with AHSA1/START domain
MLQSALIWLHLCTELTNYTMNKGIIAEASIAINAPVSKVWGALTNPAMIKQYFFGSDVVSDWKEGSPIVWKGQWEGKPYEDKGQVLQTEPGAILQFSHYSPLMGKPDVPENYHTVTYKLANDGEYTHVVLTQDNNANEKEMQHSRSMWQTMLEGLKKVVEK